MSPEYMTTEGCNTKHKETMDVLNAINDRLYKDNGNKSIQSILNEHERILSVVLWVVGIVGSSLLVAMVAGIIAIVRHVFVGG